MDGWWAGGGLAMCWWWAVDVLVVGWEWAGGRRAMGWWYVLASTIGRVNGEPLIIPPLALHSMRCQTMLLDNRSLGAVVKTCCLTIFPREMLSSRVA